MQGFLFLKWKVFTKTVSILLEARYTYIVPSLEPGLSWTYQACFGLFLVHPSPQPRLSQHIYYINIQIFHFCKKICRICLKPCGNSSLSIQWGQEKFDWQKEVRSQENIKTSKKINRIFPDSSTLKWSLLKQWKWHILAFRGFVKYNESWVKITNQAFYTSFFQAVIVYVTMSIVAVKKGEMYWQSLIIHPNYTSSNPCLWFIWKHPTSWIECQREY